MTMRLLSLLLAFALGALAMRFVPPLFEPAPARLRGMAAAPCPLPAHQRIWAGFDDPDWTGLCHYHADNARRIAAGERVETVFFGDSIFADWDDADPGFFADGRVNRGIGGQTSVVLLARFRNDVLALRPRKVHILVGLNDVAGSSGIVSPDSFIANIETLVDLAEGHGVVPVLATIQPAGSFDQPGLVDPAPWIAELNRRLKALAARRGLALADYHAVLADAQGRPIARFYRDSVHPSAAGYQAMRPVALAALAEAGIKQRSTR